MMSESVQPLEISSAIWFEQECRTISAADGYVNEMLDALTRYGYLDTSSNPSGVLKMPSKSLPRPTLSLPATLAMCSM